VKATFWIILICVCIWLVWSGNAQRILDKILGRRTVYHNHKWVIIEERIVEGFFGKHVGKVYDLRCTSCGAIKSEEVGDRKDLQRNLFVASLLNGGNGYEGKEDNHNRERAV